MDSAGSVYPASRMSFSHLLRVAVPWEVGSNWESWVKDASPSPVSRFLAALGRTHGTRNSQGYQLARRLRWQLLCLPHSWAAWAGRGHRRWPWLPTGQGQRKAGMEVLWLHSSLASRIQLQLSDTVVPPGQVEPVLGCVGAGAASSGLFSPVVWRKWGQGRSPCSWFIQYSCAEMSGCCCVIEGG